jgi:flavin-dependent thymidylate synthase
MGNEIQKWADDFMFEAEPMPFDVQTGPRAYLLQGTPDPLGSIAAFAAMYKGEVVRDKKDVTDEERRYYLAEMQKTKLKAPMEAVNLHFMIEGVTRSFTHQMVRQRTAVFAQESLRFAVKDGIDEEVALPPSIAGLPDDDPKRVLWQQAVNRIDDVYSALVDSGMPAEDARGLLPHNITTRLNYATNLRNYQDHAGNRLCTQAQFEWRMVWVRMLEAMRAYCTGFACLEDSHDHEGCDNWQWIAISELFRPVCYYTGNCQFLADFDRKCSIRNRVMANAEIGRPSSEWDKEHDAVEGNPIVSGVGPTSVVRDTKERPVFIGAIHPAEWLMDAGAAR